MTDSYSLSILEVWKLPTVKKMPGRSRLKNKQVNLIKEHSRQ